MCPRRRVNKRSRNIAHPGYMSKPDSFEFGVMKDSEMVRALVIYIYIYTERDEDVGGRFSRAAHITQLPPAHTR